MHLYRTHSINSISWENNSEYETIFVDLIRVKDWRK